MTTDTSDKLFCARIEDMYRQCERTCGSVYSLFLDERQCAEAELICRRHTGEEQYAFWGGFENAQRKMLCIYSEYCAGCFMEEFPMKCLTFTYRKEDKLTHRDFLGSFMAMRLKRETIGDIIIGCGEAQVMVSEVAAKLITSLTSKIGRVGVKVTDTEPFRLEVRQEFEYIGGTAASMRLDCIVSLAAKVSREKAAMLIRSEKVCVNHLPSASVSRELCEGDVITIRGFGKFILKEAGGTTKKGRIHINLCKYK